MRQRVAGESWRSPGGSPRVLIEDDHPALAISDFTAFHQAGFDVAYCSGPDHGPQGCPLLRGGECAALAGADAVLHGLDQRLGIAEAIRRRRPDLAVVVERHRFADGSLEAVPDGCAPLTFPCSVNGQLDALREALSRQAR